MKTIISFFILSSIILANDAIKANTYFNFISSDKINLPHQNTHKLDLIVVIDINSKWLAKLNEEINKTQKTLALCDIQISSIELVKVSIPPKTINQLNIQNPYAGPPELKIALEGLPNNILTAFLIDKYTRNGTAFAINRNSVLNSERYPTLPSWSPLENTTWITENFIPYSSAPGADKTYSTLAHEIVHIIGNLGHLENNQEPNLMGGNDNVAKSYALTQSQCDAIVNYWF